ncbi:type I TA system toxin YonT [Bacillus subtilis]|uniref:type I TA system toxin YonT n=1 Tax=Bacillus subtilis TaxID=1423 RepID=UPI003982EE15
MLEKVGIIVAFLISLTVLTINSLTIVEKVRNLKNRTSKKKKRIRKRLRPKRQRQRIRR